MVHTLGIPRKTFASRFTTTAKQRDEFMLNVLPWLIGVPVSLIIIHTFSL